MKLRQIPKTDIEYVEFYAEKLKENPDLFNHPSITNCGNPKLLLIMVNLLKLN